MLYHPLNTDSFRLLRLHRDTPSASLSGSLVEVPLNAAPRYFALSYSWGTHAQEVPIYIDGQVLLVAPSQANAIRRLLELGNTKNGNSSKPSYYFNTPIEYVWIDRICINQQDTEERSSQVQFMRAIYSQAVRTLIWLGHEADLCFGAWKLVDQIYDVFKRENPAAKYLADIPLNTYSNARHRRSGLPAWDHAVWGHLERLFQLPWFTRVWVIQEVVLSHGDPVILHGENHEYPWSRLGWAASWLRRNGYLRLERVPNRMQMVDTISNIRRSPTRWSLGALLVATSTKCHATDQRDKVYGLLGIAAESEAAPGSSRSGLPEALRPDYSLGVHQVYARVASFLLAEYKTLSALTRAGDIDSDVMQAQRKYSIKHLPSWVPNWSDFAVVERDISKSLSWLDIPSAAETNVVAALGFPAHYRASTQLEAKFQLSQDLSKLRVGGLAADTIVAVFHLYGVSSSFDTDAEAAFTSRLLCAWETAAPFLPHVGVSEWICSFIKATTADQYLLWGQKPEQLLRDGAAFLLQALSGSGHLASSGTGVLTNLLAKMAMGGNSDLYVALARNFCLNRTFAVTSHGRLGIAPAGTREGDEIAVIFGGEVPYVLRRLDGDTSYHFIGESYVYGLMGGEIIATWKRGELTEEVFELW
ncbi:heterokaryon incompatibility protein 6, OR allele [Trichoderma asperellum]|uniref:Heterokaryon incompatibility protein 6, OR allele n=1 Tax=Trichoderma asperellum TaxID=101201 RepID=A0A6V8QHL1_TRIAP|nr:heterokaryon incompatibility protein 6, OR allele [Trichoderma asperellum]